MKHKKLKCCKCKWIGLSDDLGIRREYEDGYYVDTNTCPNCKGDQFIVIKQKEVTK